MDGVAAPLPVGAAGERAALAHYRRAGYRLLARNWRCPLGELDLVLARGRTIVFCEVKTRRGATLGGPFDAVTWRKQAKLRGLAQAFLARAGGLEWDEVRFDVASVSAVLGGPPVVYVFEAAF
jgi:putative endonuclease